MTRGQYEALMRAAKDLAKHPEYWMHGTYDPGTERRCVMTHLIGPANVSKDYRSTYLSLSSLLVAAQHKGFDIKDAEQIVLINDGASDPKQLVCILREEFG